MNLAKQSCVAILAMVLACAGCSTPPPPPPKMAATPPVATAKPIPKTADKHIRLALLLPLTGNSAPLGQAMLDAANLAVFDQANKNFELLPEDTGDTPEQAKQAADRALAGKARLIIGPIFAGAAAVVGPEANTAHLPVISFTTDAAAAHDNVFVIGFLPSLEVRRILTYARSKGIDSFAVLAPNNSYGNLTTAVLQSAVPGATIVRYPPGTTDFAALAQQLKAKAPGAILLPEGGNELRAIAKALIAAGIDPKQTHLLGTGLWDDPTLAQEPALSGGWYAGTAPTARADFEKRFFDTYKYKPQRLCTLAYDATALAIVLGKQAVADPYSRAAITKESGFAGLDGVFRFGSNGQIERALSILQINPTGPTVIDPAPQAFTTSVVGDVE